MVYRPGWTTVKGGKGVIVAWRDDLVAEVHATRWHTAHSGRAGVTPARGTLELRLRLVDGTLLGVLCGHRINGTGWPGVRTRSFHRWRRRRWLEHHALDEQLTGRLVADGYTVVLGGDLNRKGTARDPMPRPHPAAVPLRASGITQLWFVPGTGCRLQRLGAGGAVARLASGSSHRLQWSDLTRKEIA